MGLARSSFYDKSGGEKRLTQSEADLVKEVKRIQEKFPLYGYRRLVAVFKRQGVAINHKKMLRILKTHDLSPKPLCKRRVKTTDSTHTRVDFDNLLRGRVIDDINQVWACDITYLRVGARFAYLAILLDVYSRRVFGYGIAHHLASSLCEAALAEALVARAPKAGCIHHSDHGTQYTSSLYVQMLTEAGF